jgi:hypothetical protein
VDLKIEKVPFLGWQEAYRLSLGEAAMVVVTEIGPRILSLSAGGGPNLLFVDEGLAGQQGGAEWVNYGGHRIWVSPETASTYAPDNGRCEVEVSDDGLTALSPVEPRTGLRKRLTIAAQGRRFVVEQGVLNTVATVYTGAVWALTCVAPGGVIAFPWGRGGDNWDLKKVVYWKKWIAVGTDVNSQQWQPGPDLFKVVPTGEVGKVGTNSPEGWIALCREDATFVKAHRWVSGARYPDEDCSMQIYTCPQLVEMETLSPLTTFWPGEEVAHREIWTVTAQAIDPDDGEALRGLARG